MNSLSRRCCVADMVTACAGPRTQSGMVLILGLALLAGLSLLGIMAGNSMLQQKQMAANHADSELARLSAMTAIGSGEGFLLALPAAARRENCPSDCFADPVRSVLHTPDMLPAQPEYLPDDWWSGWGLTGHSAAAITSRDAMAGTAWSLPGRYPPQFVLQEIKFVAIPEMSVPEDAPRISGIGYYRILGRGTGIAPNSSHVVEAIFARPWQMQADESPSAGIDCKAFRPWYDCGRMAYRERR